MQGNSLIMVILGCQIVVSLSDDNIVERNDDNISALEHLDQRRQLLPIFPKSNVKYTVTPKPHEKAYSLSPKPKIMTKMPLKQNIGTKLESITLRTIQQVNRKPLMKLRKFTIQSRANGKYDIVDKYIYSSRKVHTTTRSDINKNDLTKLFKEDYKKAKVYLPEENRTNVDMTPHFSKNNDKALDDVDNQENDDILGNQNADEYLFEEKKDRKEFIFLEKMNEKIVTKDMIDSAGQDYNDETTTENIVEQKLRLKRSKNIIEEENLASTVSGLKYTWRDTRLNNELYFKNINS